MEGAEPDGLSLTGDEAAIVLQPDAYLDRETIARIASTLKPRYDRVVVHYFRAADGFDESTLAEDIVCRRVPTEVPL